MVPRVSLSLFLPLLVPYFLPLIPVASAAERLYCVPWSFRCLLPVRLMRFAKLTPHRRRRHREHYLLASRASAFAGESRCGNVSGIFNTYAIVRTCLYIPFGCY